DAEASRHSGTSTASRELGPLCRSSLGATHRGAVRTHAIRRAPQTTRRRAVQASCLPTFLAQVCRRLVGVDALLNLVFGAKLFTTGARWIVGTLNVADADRAAVFCLGYDFRYRTVCQPNAITKLQVVQVLCVTSICAPALAVCRV